MFKMIGGDGREYGPVSAEQIRAWIAEQRANGATLVQAEGTTDWLPLAQLPEFADALAAAAAGQDIDHSPSEPVLESAGGGFRTTDEALPVADCLARGWALVTRHFGFAAGGALLVWLMITVLSLASCVGVLLNLLLSGALYGGLTVLYLNLIRGYEASFKNLFSGFGPAFVPLMLVWLVSWLLSQLGLAFCIVPGLFLKVIWAFGLALVADKQMAFWPALELSRQAVMRQFLPVVGLMVLAYLPLIVFETYSVYRVSSYMLEHFGPPTAWQFADLKDKMEDFYRFAAELGLQEHLVLLLNLPFATASTLHAYEHLFHHAQAKASG